MQRYEKFNLEQTIRHAENYLTSMVDEKLDYLPYWMIQTTEKPAFARHVRVDDAELVASWYEGLSCTMRILGDNASPKDREVLAGFRKHLMRSWGEHGLRFHEPYPWSNIIHSSFHEMAYVLSALNRVQEDDPENAEVEKRASELVRGMRELVLERKIKTFWNGDFEFEDKIYEFPSDIYIQGQGFVPERITGRGEMAIRNGMVLHPLVVRAERKQDDVALDLAVGLANQLLQQSRYINYRGEYFGHVHSTVWIAMGLVRLGRLLHQQRYTEAGHNIFRYTKSISSTYGWVPEYANWHPAWQEQCETCCIRDMIECALELIDSGYDEWETVDRFTRNHLAQQQFTWTAFVETDNTREDAPDRTWKHMDRRVIGGWTGGGEANYISLSKFRSVAGCCVGTAPQALYNVWHRIAVKDGHTLTVNLPMDYADTAISVETDYPDSGRICMTLKTDADLRIRPYSYMGNRIGLTVNGRPVPIQYSEGLLFIPGLKAGDIAVLTHPMETVIRDETVQEKLLHVYWRGNDVIRITPEGEHLRLYQRDLTQPKYLPAVSGQLEKQYTGPTK